MDDPVRRVEEYTQMVRLLTGLSLAAFVELLPAFERPTQRTWRSGMSVEPRHASADTGGQKRVLAQIEDKLLFILFYFECTRCRSGRVLLWDGTATGE